MRIAIKGSGHSGRALRHTNDEPEVLMQVWPTKPPGSARELL